MSDSSSNNSDDGAKQVKFDISSDTSSGSSYEEEVTEVDIKAQTKEGDGEPESHDKMTSQQQLPLPPPPQPRRKRFIPKYDVEGVSKVILSEETQLAVEIVVGNHVNAQYPWAYVERKKILEHIYLGRDLSEFFPLKEQLEAYKEDQVLMGYIPDESKDDSEFYVCWTEESRKHCKQQSDRFIKRQEKKLEKAVSKKPRPWTSLGSEEEITCLIPVYTRPLMEVEIKAAYPTKYDPVKFNIRDVLGQRDGFIELTPYRQKFNNVFRRRVDCASQVGDPKETKHVQTVLRYPQNQWTQSIADSLGEYDPYADEDEFFGSSEDSSSDEDNKKKKRRKKPIDDVGLLAFKKAFRRLRRPSYVKLLEDFLEARSPELQSILELNTVMDIYNNDYPDLVVQKKVDIYDTMKFEEYVCFTDVRAKDKYVSSAVFHPMWSGIVAICYADGSPTVMTFLGPRPDPIQRAVYGLNPVMIWSHIDSLMPKLYLECSREVKVLAFCPFNENILVGGCVNGQVVLWDLTNKLDNVEKIEVLTETREKYRIAMNAHMDWMKRVHDNKVVPATAMSNLMTGHYGPITSIKWLSPNYTVTLTGQTFPEEKGESSIMFFTGSEDGTILVWNLSIENMSLLETTKKVKRSRRVPRRPSGLTVDVSPYRVLDRILNPVFKIILGVAGKSQMLPVQTMAMDPPPVKYIYTPRSTGSGRKYFKCEVIPQSETEVPDTIFCGSQHGELRRIKWEGHPFNTGELVNSEYCGIVYSCHIHDGIICCTARNPFLNHVTLTVGGKIFAIWHSNCLGRPLIWKKRKCRLTDAAWSMYKPSLLFVTTSEGDLETWDLLLRSDQPIAVQTISGSMLTGVSLHVLPLKQNIIGVSDDYGSFRMFLNPPIFMLENPSYTTRMDALLDRELKVMQSYIDWQREWVKNNPHIMLEIKRKEGALLAEKEEEKRKQKEEEDARLEAEAEERAKNRAKAFGPEERWQHIIQKLIERTIAVKKRINKAQLLEYEKPLRELEAQRLEKERRVYEIMKNQKTIFNDTVAILFPEAIKKPSKPKLLSDDKKRLKKEYLEDYAYLKGQAFKTVRDNPYKVAFNWDATLAEGKERREALNAYDNYVKMHKGRLDLDNGIEGVIKPPPKPPSEPEAED